MSDPACVSIPSEVRSAVRNLTGADPVAVRFCTQGYAFQVSAVLTVDDGRDVFAKWVDPAVDPARLASAGAALHREAGNMARLGSLAPCATLIGASDDPAVLVTEALTGPEPDWATPGTFTDALDALDALSAADRSVAVGRTLLGWDAFAVVDRDDTHAVSVAAGHRTARLDECAAQLASLPMRTVAHIDAHPRNWVTHQGALHLVDLDHMALAPRGWDAVYLASFLDLDAELRADAVLARAPAARAVIMSGAITRRFARGTRSAEPGWKAWCGDVLPAALALFDALERRAAR